MQTGQQIELEVDRDLAGFFTRCAIAARVASNDLIVAWREDCRRAQPVRIYARKLLKEPGPRQERPRPPENADWTESVKPLLQDAEGAAVSGPFQWARYGLGGLRPLLNRQRESDRPWFNEVLANAVKGGYIDGETADRRFYRKQSRWPKLKDKGRRLAFRADNGVGTVRVSGRWLYLPGSPGRWVKLKEPLRWAGKEIRECRVREQGGRWFAGVRFDITPEEYGQGCGVGTIGMDLGLENFLSVARPGDTEATVQKLDGPEPLKRSLGSLRRKQRELSRKQQGSKNRQKAKVAVARAHRRVGCIRKDFLHKLSHDLTAEAEMVQVESLSIKGWQKRWGRKTSDLAPGEFLRQLEYKAGWRGGEFLRAEWHFPSSQLCHQCGWKAGRLKLSVRKWWCEGCGEWRDRDANAALNIRDYRPGASG